MDGKILYTLFLKRSQLLVMKWCSVNLTTHLTTKQPPLTIQVCVKCTVIKKIQHNLNSPYQLEVVQNTNFITIKTYMREITVSVVHTN